MLGEKSEKKREIALDFNLFFAPLRNAKIVVNQANPSIWQMGGPQTTIILLKTPLLGCKFTVAKLTGGKIAHSF
jgi:hypothetical protein